MMMLMVVMGMGMLMQQSLRDVAAANFIDADDGDAGDMKWS